MRFGMILGAAVIVTGCTQAPVARPPVVDASWRATEDDRVLSRTDVNSASSRIISGPDRTREQGETNVVVPVEPIARIEPIDQPADAEGMSPAVLSLLEQADQLRTAGDFTGASSRLERAQRIAPDEPEVYFQLAGVRLEQGRFDEAVNIATQAVDLAGSDNAMKRDLYTLVARARESAGDTAGASQARQMARSFGS
jgi:Putative Zn-dependent protease, contains TPR repeats